MGWAGPAPPGQDSLPPLLLSLGKTLDIRCRGWWGGWGGQGCPTLGVAGPGVGGRSSPLIKVSGRQRGVGGLGQASHPRPRTPKCVSWMRIQGNCASPHSVCSEANAFLSYCLCRRLVVGTPIISSLGERPRCSKSGWGRPDSNEGDRRPAGSTLGSRGVGEVPRRTGRLPKASQDVSWLVAGNATPWEGKGGADGRTCGVASLRGRGASTIDGQPGLAFPSKSEWPLEVGWPAHPDPLSSLTPHTGFLPCSTNPRRLMQP